LPNGYSKGAQKGLSREYPNGRIFVMAHQSTVTRPSLLGPEGALIAAAARALGQRLRAAIVRRLPGVFDRYRPELHYMRGPGPRWREKQRMAARGRAER
jgi:hypothetical protein